MPGMMILKSRNRLVLAVLIILSAFSFSSALAQDNSSHTDSLLAEYKENSQPLWDLVYSEFKPPENSAEGMVVSRKSKVFVSRDPYDPYVYGVVVDSCGNLRIAVGGEVVVLADLATDTINQGDWLVTSGAYGTVMPAMPDFPYHPTVLGAALNRWTSEDSTQLIKVLLTPGEKVSIPRAVYPENR